MIRSILCDYSDAYRLISGTIAITGEEANDSAKQADERNKELIFKNCVTFTDCISTIDNTQTVNTKDIDVVMLMDNLIKYSDNYSKTSGSLW